MKVGLLYNTIENAPKPNKNAPKDILYELDHWSTVESYKKALELHGHSVFPIEGNEKLPSILKKIKVDLCFNTCEGYRGANREAQVPALLEMIGIPYSGSKPISLSISLDKTMAKTVASYFKIPTPKFQLLTSVHQNIASNLHYPLFVKPNSQGTGIGIGKESIVSNPGEVKKRAAYLFKAYKEPVLIEEYIDGRDVTVGIVGNEKDIHLFPVSMIENSTYINTGSPVYGAEMKIDLADKFKYLCPAPLNASLTKILKNLALEVKNALRILDYARIDFRLDKNDNPYFLEINGLPGITPFSDLTLMAQAEGWTHADLVYSVFTAAVKRLGL